VAISYTSVENARDNLETELPHWDFDRWIKDYSAQLSIFPDENPNKLLHLNHCIFLGVQYNFFYNQITALLDRIGLGNLPALLKDLVTIRIFEPASKLRSLELMGQYFGIHHNRKTYYKMAPGWIELKDEVERAVMSFAKKWYSFNYELIFYDVTTLFLKLSKKTSCERMDSLRTTSLSNHRYWWL
jgi:hypothetical protein